MDGDDMKRNTKGGTDQVTLVREVIASGTVTRLDRCGCGDLYLTVGPITMALHPEALADLGATVARAMATLGCAPARPRPDADQSSPPPAGTLGPEAAADAATAPEPGPRDEELN
jgi:hypothetical protein